MRATIIVCVELDADSSGADQRIAAAFSLISLNGTAYGRKGIIRLPPGTYMGIRHFDHLLKETPAETLERMRTSAADEISQVLADLNIRGSFFLQVSRIGAWAFRPVPRNRKDIKEDESSVDAPAVSAGLAESPKHGSSKTGERALKIDGSPNQRLLAP